MQPVWPADDSDPSAALQSVSQRARMLTRSSGAAIALAHKGSMICRASVGNAPTLGSRVDVSTGFSGECVRAGKVLRCNNSENDPRVDADSCRRLNIRSILAAPIRLGGEVVGILEVFSPQRFAFHDSDLAVVEHLAETVLAPPASKTVPLKATPPSIAPWTPTPSIAPWTPTPPGTTSPRATPLRATPPSTAPPKTPPRKTTPALSPDRRLPTPSIAKAPNLLLQLEPAYRIFFGNLVELLHPPDPPPLKLTSLPATFWPDVLVPSQLPWDRFGQSMLLHGVMVVALVLLEFGLSQRPMLRQSRLTFNKSDVIYYLPSEYPRLGKRESGLPRPAKAQPPPSLQQPLLAVRRDSVRRTQAPITPPEIESKQDLRSLRIIASNPTMPAVPFSATTGRLPSTPGGNVAAVAPPPDISAVARAQHFTLQTPAVVEPAPSVHPPIGKGASISIGHMEVVRPAPEIPLGALSAKAQATLNRTATSVVPPAPSVQGLGDSGQSKNSPTVASTQVVPPPPSWFQVLTSYLSGAPEHRAALIVPPPPAMNGLGHSGGQNMSSLPGAGTQVVPPAPQLQGGGVYGRGSGGSLAVAVVPPPPSMNNLGQPGGRSGGSLGAPGTQVVPPAPQLQAGGAYARGHAGGIAVAAVPPPPSVKSLGRPGGRSLGSLGAPGSQVAPPAIAAHNGGNSSKQTMLASGLPGGLLPGEIVDQSEATSTDSKEVSNASQINVNFIGPALVLPSSSYFSSCEVFIAEERLTRHQSRLIKLVYDFLPYQPRLSDLGPNYPTLENLRATRDPSCDEPLRQAVSSANTAGWPQAARLQLNAKSSQQRQSTLACYRTTADDYRRARARQPR
jgi:hypothetical protein